MGRKSVESLYEEDDDGDSIFGDEPPPVSDAKARWKKFSKIASEFDMFEPAIDVLTSVRAVPTIFLGFDHGTRVGGLPIERFTLLHGESAGGKTYFAIGLLLSFLMKDHPAVLIDAERTTPMEWLMKSMGEYAHHPFFRASRPTTYEDTVMKVRHFVNRVKKLRDDGKLKDDTSALLVVDSIRKLVPEDQFKRIIKAAKQAGDKKEKVRDRSAQIKAAMNAAWMDELVPLLEQTKTAMVVIARETEDPDASPQAKMFGNNYKVGGGNALYYDASMAIRVERQTSTGKKITVGDREKWTSYGDRHRITIRKSKVAGKGETNHTICHFHTSNGIWVPEGFDRARDLVEMGAKFGVIEAKKSKGERKASGFIYDGEKWRGENDAVQKLQQKPKLMRRLEAEIRAKFENVKPLTISENGEVLEGDEDD